MYSIRFGNLDLVPLSCFLCEPCITCVPYKLYIRELHEFQLGNVYGNDDHMKKSTASSWQTLYRFEVGKGERGRWYLRKTDKESQRKESWGVDVSLLFAAKMFLKDAFFRSEAMLPKSYL